MPEELRHRISKWDSMSKSTLNTSAPLGLPRNFRRNILVLSKSSLKSDHTHSPFAFLMLCALFTLYFTSPNSKSQLRTPFPTVSNHLRLRSKSTENPNLKSPKFWTPRLIIDVAFASYSIWSDGQATKEPTKKLPGYLPPSL